MTTGTGICTDMEYRLGMGGVLGGAANLAQPVVDSVERPHTGVRNMPIGELGDPRIADAGLRGDVLPRTSAGEKLVSDLRFDGLCAHAETIAKLCYSFKQHFASNKLHTAGMNVNDILAANLARLMTQHAMTQQKLAKESGVAQTTVSLYLNPQRRQPSATGKIPSAKLTEVEKLAAALQVDTWELLRPDGSSGTEGAGGPAQTPPLTPINHGAHRDPLRTNIPAFDDPEDPFPMMPRAPNPWESDWKADAQPELAPPPQISAVRDVVANVSAGGHASNDEFEPVPELPDVRLSAGEGLEVFNEAADGVLQFRSSFLRQHNADGGRGRVVYAAGDSMEPVILDGAAMLLVPAPGLSLSDVASGGVWAINYGGKMLVKTIARQVGGSWVARSFNRRYPDIVLNGDVEVQVLGRIVWAGATLPADIRGQWIKG